MNDEIDLEAQKQLTNLWKKLKSFKKLYVLIDILGNIAIIITLFLHQWFMAFLLFIMFFPDEIDIIRFFKKIRGIAKST